MRSITSSACGVPRCTARSSIDTPRAWPSCGLLVPLGGLEICLLRGNMFKYGFGGMKGETTGFLVLIGTGCRPGGLILVSGRGGKGGGSLPGAVLREDSSPDIPNKLLLFPPPFSLPLDIAGIADAFNAFDVFDAFDAFDAVCAICEVCAGGAIDAVGVVCALCTDCTVCVTDGLGG